MTGVASLLWITWININLKPGYCVCKNCLSSLVREKGDLPSKGRVSPRVEYPGRWSSETEARWVSTKSRHHIELGKWLGDIYSHNHANVIFCEKCISKADASHHLIHLTALKWSNSFPGLPGRDHCVVCGEPAQRLGNQMTRKARFLLVAAEWVSFLGMTKSDLQTWNVNPHLLGWSCPQRE